MLRYRLLRLRSGGAFAPLLLVSALAAITGLVVASVTGRAEAALRRYGTPRSVAVATRTIPLGAVVADADVALRTWPAGLVPPGALTSPPVGRTATATTFAGEVLLAGRLAPGGLSGVAALLPPGTRALAVPLSGAGPPLSLGDRVDLLATFDPVLAGDGEPTVPVAEAATVVGLDDRSDAVTVAVSSTEAARVAFALTQGTVVVALGGPS